jgi:hypothetical protein
MNLHKNFKGNLQKLNQIVKRKNYKRIFDILKLVITSYKKKYSFDGFLIRLQKDADAINKYKIKHKCKKIKNINLDNIILLLKFTFHSLYIKYLDLNKDMYGKGEFIILHEKCNKKFLFYSRKFFIINIKETNMDELNTLLIDCNLV